MTIRKESISSETELFHACNNIILLEPNANNFLIAYVDNKSYGIAWNGSIDAKFELLQNNEILAIGAGESVVCVSLEMGIVKLALGLGYPFGFFEEVEIGFIIVSELTIVEININDWSIGRFIVAPDIIMDAKVLNGKYVIKCLDSEYQI